MSNLIDRQKAIDEWKNDFKGYVNALNIPRDDYNGIMAYIDELPSAQPEPCEDDYDPCGNPLKVRLEIEGSTYEVLAKDLRNALDAVVKNGKFTRVTTWAISKEPYREGGGE